MVSVKAISTDEVFIEWVNKADLKTLEKFFKKKKVDFKRDHVSVGETVKNVSKFIVVAFEKDVKEAMAGAAGEKTEKITANQLEKVKFWDFEGKKVKTEDWKEKAYEVPIYKTIKEVKCAKCGGTGSEKCKKCNGAGSVKCNKCDGKTKFQCGKCKGEKTVVYDLDISNAEGKKFKATKRPPCPECHGVGNYVCPDCSGIGKARCKACDSRGVTPCNDCKGYGIFYEYKIQPVPVLMEKKSAVVFYRKDVEKFISKTDVEQNLSKRNILGIVLTNPDDLKEGKLKPELNYWTKESDKICNEAKKEYKNLVKKKAVKEGAKITVFPALELDCESVKGKKFQIFGIGTSGSFVVLEAGFK
ncbi:MAG: hypothetical protein ACFFCS_13100 [Candidatus Hodarchaeota archaeon]